MTTRETAKFLAAAARRFPLPGDITELALLKVVESELGHADILDDFQSYTGHMAMATGPGTILHIISGNTPHAGLQSLLRGLLLKSRNLCKIPSGGLPEMEQFRNALPDELKERIEISPELPQRWLEEADAIIVFGGDETVEHFRRMARDGVVFIGHGHKVSLGIIFEDQYFESVPGAARDASFYDQQGCLSPHAFYVNGGIAEKYAELLAAGMEKFNATTPRTAITAQEAAAITALRNDFAFRAANGEKVKVWNSRHGTDWTVVFDSDPGFIPSPLNRVVFVKPLPPSLDDALFNIRKHIGAIAIHPATLENARIAAALGASRICRVGAMQEPPVAWHQDGGQNLAPLVRWVDFEP